MHKNNLGALSNVEQQRCFDSLDYLYSKGGHDDAQQLLQSMQKRLAELSGEPKLTRINTPYMNTISPEDEPEYPGDIEIENKIKSWVQWNAMAMVVKIIVNMMALGGIFQRLHLQLFCMKSDLTIFSRK